MVLCGGFWSIHHDLLISHLLIILDYFLEVGISDKSNESDSESLKLDAWPLFHPTPRSLRCLTD